MMFLLLQKKKDLLVQLAPAQADAHAAQAGVGGWHGRRAGTLSRWGRGQKAPIMAGSRQPVVDAAALEPRVSGA